MLLPRLHTIHIHNTDTRRHKHRATQTRTHTHVLVNSLFFLGWVAFGSPTVLPRSDLQTCAQIQTNNQGRGEGGEFKPVFFGMESFYWKHVWEAPQFLPSLRGTG